MSKAFEPIELGDRVRDPVTGFEGIASVVSTWLHGCVRIAVQPEKVDKEGKVRPDQYFDQSQLVVVKKRVHAPMALEVKEVAPIARRSNGGPAREGSNYRPVSSTSRRT